MANIGFRESLEREFKRDRDKPLNDDELTEVVVSLANTNGGELYIGVDDSGEISGLNPKHAEPEGLATVIANKTLPPHPVRVEVVNGLTPYIIVHVPKYKWGFMATSSGKYLRRRIKIDGTPEMVPVSPNEFSSRITNLGLFDYSAQPIPELTRNDLDPAERDRLRKIIRQYHERSDASLLDLSDEELDKALHLIQEVDGQYRPTVAGLLLIGKEEVLEAYFPTAKTTFQVISGTSIRVNEEFSKPLLKTMEIISERLTVWNPETELESGMYRISIPEFDTRAFREAVINAYSHRDYTILQRTRILIDDTGLTVSSPGGFLDGITLNNLLTTDPHSRNPCLSDAFKRIGLAEKTGRGIDRIFEGMLICGKPLPDYSESNSTIVKVRLYRANPDKAFTLMIIDTKKRLGQNLSIETLMILYTLKSGQAKTCRNIAETCRISPENTNLHLKSLINAGLLEEKESGKKQTFQINPAVYRPPGDTIHRINQNETETEEQISALLQLAKTKGYITRKDVMETLNVSDTKAYRILRKQVNAKTLILTGTRKSAKYYPSN